MCAYTGMVYLVVFCGCRSIYLLLLSSDGRNMSGSSSTAGLVFLRSRLSIAVHYNSGHFSFLVLCVCAYSSHYPIGPQPYPVIYHVVANPVVRGLLDRKRSREHLQIML